MVDLVFRDRVGDRCQYGEARLGPQQVDRPAADGLIDGDADVEQHRAEAEKHERTGLRADDRSCDTQRLGEDDKDVGAIDPVSLARSRLRSKVKVVRTEDFDPAVRAFVVHRPPAGRFARPIEVFRDALDREFRTLGKG